METTSVLYLKSLSNTQKYLKYTHVYLYLNHANSLTNSIPLNKKLFIIILSIARAFLGNIKLYSTHEINGPIQSFFTGNEKTLYSAQGSYTLCSG